LPPIKQRTDHFDCGGSYRQPKIWWTGPLTKPKTVVR
jgi:hypothetical protein